MALDAIEGALSAKRADLPAAGITARTLEAWEAAARAPTAGGASAAAAAAATPAASAAATPAAAAAGGAAPCSDADAADEQAEKLKVEGNEALAKQRFAHAEELYSQAIDIAPAGRSSHIYFACVGLSFPPTSAL